MNGITLFAFFLLVSFSASSQVAKRNWLFGGNAAFSSVKSSSTLGQNKQRNIEVNGNAGYFFADKFAAGIRSGGGWNKGAGTTSVTVYTVGPFLRYYFLPVDSKVNVFAEGSYAYGTEKSKFQTAHSNKYAFLCGPVYFLNSAVGLEFSIGYSIQKYGSSNGKTNIFQTGIGFQFHLIRDGQ